MLTRAIAGDAGDAIGAAGIADDVMSERVHEALDTGIMLADGASDVEFTRTAPDARS